MKVFIEEKYQKLIILNLIQKEKLQLLFLRKKSKIKEILNESDKKKIKKLILK